MDLGLVMSTDGTCHDMTMLSLTCLVVVIVVANTGVVLIVVLLPLLHLEKFAAALRSRTTHSAANQAR